MTDGFIDYIDWLLIDWLIDHCLIDWLDWLFDWMIDDWLIDDWLIDWLINWLIDCSAAFNSEDETMEQTFREHRDCTLQNQLF